MKALYLEHTFRCHAPMPEVRDLYLGKAATIDAATARGFTGLARLRIESARKVALRSFGRPPLEGLAARDEALADWEALRETRVERLSLQWTTSSLVVLPVSLRRLSIARLRTREGKDLDPIWGLDRLESLSLSGLELRSFQGAARLPRLTELAVRLRSFDGISRLAPLRALRAQSKEGCPPVAELSSSGGLRELQIRAAAPPADLQELGKLGGLERLSLVFGDAGALAPLRSLSFLGSLAGLQELQLTGVDIGDADLGVVRGLPALKRLTFRGKSTARQDDLTKRLGSIPEVTISLAPG